MPAPPLDPQGVDLIASFEGLRLDAYQDQAGLWTIGYGHCSGVIREGDCWTLEQCRAQLIEDMGAAAAAVWGWCGRATPWQYAAMVSLAFNIGVGAFRSSSVLRFHRGLAYPQAAAAFNLWNKVHVDGVLVTSQGLTKRRGREAMIYRGIGWTMADKPRA
jgi:lysozyme